MTVLVHDGPLNLVNHDASVAFNLEDHALVQHVVNLLEAGRFYLFNDLVVRF